MNIRIEEVLFINFYLIDGAETGYASRNDMKELNQKDNFFYFYE